MLDNVCKEQLSYLIFGALCSSNCIFGELVYQHLNGTYFLNFWKWYEIHENTSKVCLEWQTTQVIQLPFSSLSCLADILDRTRRMPPRPIPFWVKNSFSLVRQDCPEWPAHLESCVSLNNSFLRSLQGTKSPNPVSPGFLVQDLPLKHFYFKSLDLV